MKDKLRNIMSYVFDVPIETINTDTSTENCEEWDSLSHMNLLFAIEEEFDLTLTDDEVLEMKDFSSIIGLLESKKIA